MIPDAIQAAARLVAGPSLSVRDRTLAVAVCHCVRLGLPISSDDAAKFFELYARRRREAAAVAPAHSQEAACTRLQLRLPAADLAGGRSALPMRRPRPDGPTGIQRERHAFVQPPRGQLIDYDCIAARPGEF